MGAPKQKWTSEEESALKAGIQKYGVGKWSTILKDPEFSAVLKSRSNVDLKDKWRNLNCMSNGLGSRSRGRAVQKNNNLNSNEEGTSRNSGVENDSKVIENLSLVAPKETSQDSGHGTQYSRSRSRARAAHKNNNLKLDEQVTSRSSVVVKDSKVLDEMPLAAPRETLGSGIQISRLDEFILEAISKLREPRGSSRQAIAKYIEGLNSAPPDFERTLAENLKHMTENGQLIKVKNQYRIAPKSISFGPQKTQPLSLGSRNDLSESGRAGIILLTKAQIDSELEKMKSMSAAEAAAAAAQAVAEAEAAIAEAEAAAREAEEAEAEAEAAHCFADAAQKALNCNIIRV